MQGLIHEKALEVSHLNGNILALEEELQHASHQVVRGKSTVIQEKERLAVVEETILTLKQHVDFFSQRLQALDAGVRHLLGDSLLAAGMAVYAGTLPWDVKCRLVQAWEAVLCEVGIAHTPEFSLRTFMEATSHQFTHLPRNVILDEGTETCLYLAALARPNSCSSFARRALLCS